MSTTTIKLAVFCVCIQLTNSDSLLLSNNNDHEDATNHRVIKRFTPRYPYHGGSSQFSHYHEPPITLPRPGLPFPLFHPGSSSGMSLGGPHHHYNNRPPRRPLMGHQPSKSAFPEIKVRLPSDEDLFTEEDEDEDDVELDGGGGKGTGGVGGDNRLKEWSSSSTTTKRPRSVYTTKKFKKTTTSTTTEASTTVVVSEPNYDSGHESGGKKENTAVGTKKRRQQRPTVSTKQEVVVEKGESGELGDDDDGDDDEGEGDGGNGDDDDEELVVIPIVMEELDYDGDGKSNRRGNKKKGLNKPGGGLVGVKKKMKKKQKGRDKNRDAGVKKKRRRNKVQEDRTLLTAKKAFLIKNAIILHKKKKLAQSAALAYGLNTMAKVKGFSIKAPGVNLAIGSHTKLGANAAEVVGKAPDEDEEEIDEDDDDDYDVVDTLDGDDDDGGEESVGGAIEIVPPGSPSGTVQQPSAQIVIPIQQSTSGGVSSQAVPPPLPPLPVEPVVSPVAYNSNQTVVVKNVAEGTQHQQPLNSMMQQLQAHLQQKQQQEALEKYYAQQQQQGQQAQQGQGLGVVISYTPSAGGILSPPSGPFPPVGGDPEEYKGGGGSNKKGSKNKKNKKKKKSSRPRPVDLGVKANLYKKFDELAKQTKDRLSTFIQVDVDFLSRRRSGVSGSVVRRGSMFSSRVGHVGGSDQQGSSSSGSSRAPWVKPVWKSEYPRGGSSERGQGCDGCVLKPVFIFYGDGSTVGVGRDE